MARRDKNVIAGTARGFRDILPQEALARERITNEVRECFSARGYLPVETPLLEDRAALGQAVAGCDILVNATKVGMKPLDGETLIDPAWFRPDLVVADTVYNPREPRMIREAQAAGCKAAIGGIGMLLWQGVAAFQLFTGKEMPAQEVLEKFFS